MFDALEGHLTDTKQALDDMKDTLEDMGEVLGLDQDDLTRDIEPIPDTLQWLKERQYAVWGKLEHIDNGLRLHTIHLEGEIEKVSQDYQGVKVANGWMVALIIITIVGMFCGGMYLHNQLEKIHRGIQADGQRP